MHFDKRTLEVLKNFSGINQGLCFKPGSVLRTMNVKNNIFATAKIADAFPREFAVYDLTEFLSTYSMFQDPDISFTDDHILMQSGSQRVRYFYSSPSVIISPPDKEIKMPPADISFKLWADELDQILKASSVMKLKTVAIAKDKVTVMNRTSTGSNLGNALEISVEMESKEGDEDFADYINIDLLKVISGNYTVSVVHGKLAKFESEDLTYYIALETE
jgi:hypothetical protein